MVYCKKLSILFLIIFLISCTGESIKDLSEIEVDLDRSEEGKLSDFAESIEYILLDYPEEFPMVWPHNVKFDKYNNIYIRDLETNQLFVFDSKGKFKNIFLPKGKGPGEFFQISDFQIVDGIAIIFDTSINKIIEFDSLGNFIEEFRIVNKNLNFFQGDSYILNFTSYNPEYDGFNFIKIEDGKDGFTGFIPIPKEKESIGNFDSQIGFMEDFHRDKVYFNVPMSYEIVSFDKKNGNLAKKQTLNFQRYTMPNEYLKLPRQEMYSLQEERNLVRDISSFFPFKGFYFYSIRQGMGKKNHVLILNEKDEIIYQKFNHVNDIDGMGILGFPWSFTKDEVVHLVSSGDFYNEYLKSFNGKKVKGSANNIHGFFKANESKLKDDYRILVKYKLKDFS
ncbi:6-bladed beta-propeller [Aquiflexum sp. TKW24L]|uniref:6-bladed beta-propeller n=1 Tax=Aquiflexum sp. TKW24L TaxID=2942212 RepID=UPI0020BEACBE|nr:6-bladed beta-propeller [Aquiflexum sp. TKW24L]MCL6260881.1 6-bladed beta-propeller [Aquiflexum sp. TKW24L]